MNSTTVGSNDKTAPLKTGRRGLRVLNWFELTRTVLGAVSSAVVGSVAGVGGAVVGGVKAVGLGIGGLYTGGDSSNAAPAAATGGETPK